MENQKPIGIFDSGIGGLTVLKEIQSLLSSEDVVYLGDTARVPYGTKSRSTVLKYSIQNTRLLIEQGVKAIVVACNTASAYGLESIQEKFEIPIIGVVEPGAQSAVAHTKTKKVGVIGTEGTIRSEAYQKAISELDSEIQSVAQPCPLLVSLAEEGWFEGEVTQRVLEIYLEKFKDGSNPVDTIVLGCTHYPLLKKAIQAVLGPKIFLVDSAIETARALKQVLEEQRLTNSGKSPGTTTFLATDSPESMQKVGCLFLGKEIPQVQHVEV